MNKNYSVMWDYNEQTIRIPSLNNQDSMESNFLLVAHVKMLKGFFFYLKGAFLIGCGWCPTYSNKPPSPWSLPLPWAPGRPHGPPSDSTMAGFWRTQENRYPPVFKHSHEKSTICKSVSYWKGGISIAMLDYRSVTKNTHWEKKSLGKFEACQLFLFL